MIMAYTKKEQTEAIEKLRGMLKPGDRLSTILRHVSASGMSRSISVIISDQDGINDITWLVARALDMRIDDKHQGIKIGGCGMDMGFEIVYQLGGKLFPGGFDVEGRGRNGDMSGHDNDGGYALKQSWL